VTRGWLADVDNAADDYRMKSPLRFRHPHKTDFCANNFCTSKLCMNNFCLKNFCMNYFCMNYFCMNYFCMNYFCMNKFCMNKFCMNNFCMNNFCVRLYVTLFWMLLCLIEKNKMSKILKLLSTISWIIFSVKHSD
jgi:hypothetical protein